jgi:hypothetical protein
MRGGESFNQPTYETIRPKGPDRTEPFYLPAQKRIVDFMTSRVEHAEFEELPRWRKALELAQKLSMPEVSTFLEHETKRSRTGTRTDLYDLHRALFDITTFLDNSPISDQQTIIRGLEAERDRYVRILRKAMQGNDVVKDAREAWDEDIAEAKQGNIEHVLERMDDRVMEIDDVVAGYYERKQKPPDVRFDDLRGARSIRNGLLRMLFAPELMT